MPSFSIVVPTFNRAALIKATLDSVLNQSFADFEAIVVDDGSTDCTEEKVQEINDSRIQYIKQANGERGRARNTGIKLATGNYVTFLDSDDLLYPNHLSEAARMIQLHDNPEFFHLAYEVCDSSGKVLRRMNNRSGDLNLKLVEGNHLSCLGVFVRQDIIKRHLFNESRELSGSEDWELWMRLASRYKLYYSNEVTAVLIHHPDRSVLQIDKDRLIRRITLVQQLLKNDPEFLNTYDDHIAKMVAHLSLYLALHLALAGYRKSSWQYLLKAAESYPKVVWSRKWVSILSKLILGHNS